MSEPISEALAARSVGRIFARRRFAGVVSGCCGSGCGRAAGDGRSVRRSFPTMTAEASNDSTICSVTLISDPDTGLTTGSTTGYIESGARQRLVQGRPRRPALSTRSNCGEQTPATAGCKTPSCTASSKTRAGDSVSVGRLRQRCPLQQRADLHTRTASGTYYIVAGSLERIHRRTGCG